MMKRQLCFLTLLVLAALNGIAQENNTLTPAEAGKGWILLFDGRSTDGWTSPGGQPIPEGTWSVADGCLNTVVGDKSGDIVTVGEYADFELCADYRITPGCNSGIKYLFTNYENGGYLGCEFQIIDDDSLKDILQTKQVCGSLYDLFPPDVSKKKVNPPGEWNSVRIVVKGSNIEHWLNDARILKCSRKDKSFAGAVAGSKFSETVPPFGSVEKGHILLQYHGGLVSFRNIKIREL